MILVEKAFELLLFDPEDGFFLFFLLYSYKLHSTTTTEARSSIRFRSPLKPLFNCGTQKTASVTSGVLGATEVYLGSLLYSNGK